MAKAKAMKAEAKAMKAEAKAMAEATVKAEAKAKVRQVNDRLMTG